MFWFYLKFFIICVLGSMTGTVLALKIVERKED